ncbi:MAG: hypothetical protein LKJ76_07180 [Lachnospiraceae bacterium]|nr:hypothetical protein [Lachnospiraceae bacterium]
MSTGWIVFFIILAALVAAFVVIYFLGKKAEKKQAEQREQIEANKQTVSMLVIDKKKLRLKESGLPQAVIDQTPKMLRWSKMPIVKAKVGPQIVSLVCDDKIFDSVPVKREIRAQVSGIYIVGFKGLRGAKTDTAPKKKSRFRAWVSKMQEKAGARQLK